MAGDALMAPLFYKVCFRASVPSRWSPEATPWGQFYGVPRATGTLTLHGPEQLPIAAVLAAGRMQGGRAGGAILQRTKS